MRNRAKCKACNDIIESFTLNDYVTCKCGEIEIWGGNQQALCASKHWENFLRVDDLGNEIVPHVVKKEKEIELPNYASPGKEKDDLLKILEEQLESIEKMNEHALVIPINHADLHIYLTVILAILKKM